MYLVGIDIGGTSIKMGLINDGEIVSKIDAPTNTFDIIKQIISMTYELLENNNLQINEVSGVGVGCPGIIIDGKVVESVNLHLADCNLKEILMEEFKVPVVVKNDADMATLAENRFGAGANSKNMVMITIGTGVGGGIIVNGELFVGNGCAGELGHITYDRGGILCNCGRKGCYERYVSAIALSNRALALMESMPHNIPIHDGLVYASDLILKYNEGDKCAIQVIDEYVEDMTNFIISICNIFRPEKIVIGGGITYAPQLITMIDDCCKKYNYGYRGSPAVKIVKATLGSNAGIMGTYACF